MFAAAATASAPGTAATSAGTPAQPAQVVTGGGTASQAVAPLTSGQAPAPVAAASAATPTAPAPPPPPLAAQLSPRLVALPELGQGVHRLTMDVKPESIGSVRVVADIRPDSMTISLIGGTDAAKDALRSVLADLRKDLAAAAPNATLDLGDEGRRPQGFAGQAGQAGDQSGAGTRGHGAGGSRYGAGAGEEQGRGDRVTLLKAGDGRVDVLA